MGRSLYKPMIALAVVVIAWRATAWAARDAPCKSGFDECTWTNMQTVAHGVMPVLVFAALGWCVIALVSALVHKLKAIDNRSV